LIFCKKVDGVFNFFQRSPIIIGFPMEYFGASGRLSSYEAAYLPDQGCNCCCSMGSGSAHLSATPAGLHPGQHSSRAGSTLWPHSQLHHGYHRTCNFFFPNYGKFSIIWEGKTISLQDHMSQPNGEQ